jgi:hypothetical protein
VSDTTSVALTADPADSCARDLMMNFIDEKEKPPRKIEPLVPCTSLSSGYFFQFLSGRATTNINKEWIRVFEKAQKAKVDC